MILVPRGSPTRSPGGTGISCEEGAGGVAAGPIVHRSSLDPRADPPDGEGEPPGGATCGSGASCSSSGSPVSAATIATVLRRSGLGPAPRWVGPTSTQFLRLQAFAILSGDPRTDEDDRFEDLAHNPMGSARDAKTQRPGDDDGLLQLDDEGGCSAPR